jgi:starch-binding outer membrane protein, SusD/RagB family
MTYHPNPGSGAVSMRTRSFLALALALGISGCDLDLTNPNSPPADVVLTTPQGIVSLAVGMQGQYAGTAVGSGVVLNAVRSSALVTDEWGTTSRALAGDRSLITGTVDPSFDVVSVPYTATYQVVRSAEELLEHAPNVGLAPGTRTGVVAMARTFKAMALGTAIQQYARVPVTASLEANPLQSRAVVLDTVLNLLESARADLATVTPAELADFRTQVQGTTYDLGAVVNAMLARYALMAGEYQRAIDAADRVALNRLHVFPYPDPNRNPVWGYAYSLLYAAGRNTFVTDAEPDDQRPSFWLRTDQGTVAGTPVTPLRNLRQYEQRNDPYPIFLPGEMLLIQAEAHARLGRLEDARTLVNQVRTQQSSTFNEPVAGLAALPEEAFATLDEALRRIAYERRYELYMQGLRWEDIRRLGPEIAGGTASMVFLPVPQRECLYNPANPC